MSEIKSDCIKIYRASGRPVDPEDVERYLADWQKFYDKSIERAKLDMMKLSRFLSFGAHILQKQHYKETLIHNFADLAKLQMDVGAPMLVGVDSVTFQLIAIIQDA
jgi:hypothetical protein